MSTPAVFGAVPDLWSRLHLVERRVQRRDLVRAMEQLNAVAQEAEPLKDPVLTAFLQCLIGDTEYKQGRYAAAAAAYGEVRAAYASHQEGRLLWRGGLGEVRSLLKQSEIGPASDRAAALVQAALIPAPHFSPPAGGVEVHSTMPEAPVVAARLAGQLRREGYGPEAAALLALAPATPRQSRAGLELAESLWRQGQGDAAEAHLLGLLAKAVERQRTLPVRGWQLLLQIRRTKGKTLLLPAEVTAIAALANHRRRGRIGMAAVQAARQAGEAAWTSWLDTWKLTLAPIPPQIRLCAHRLLLAEARKANVDFPWIQRLASAVMAHAKVSVDDYIAAARASLFAAVKGAGTPDAQAMVRAASRKFGPSARIRTLHSLAKAAREAGRPALAVHLYQQVRAEATPNARRRGKATHALAVLCFQQGDYVQTAALSGELAQDQNLAPEFRLQALDRQCTALRLLNRNAELQAALARVDSLLPPDLPPSTLIRMARVARLSSDFGAEGICGPLLERAVQSTLANVAQAPHPTPALTLLLELNRKLYWDFADFARVCRVWQELGAPRREWLWSERSDFWEYVSLVLRSAGKLNRHAEVAALAAMSAQDAPPEARPFTATAHADHHRENQQWAPAFAAFREAILAHPTHVECARAHYWLALKARRDGRPAAAQASLHALRRCFGSGVSLLWHWELDARTQLLLAGGDIAMVAGQSRYERPFLTAQAAAVAADESSIPAL